MDREKIVGDTYMNNATYLENHNARHLLSRISACS